MLQKVADAERVFNKGIHMVYYIFCKKCGKVVDEFEKKCHWCGCEIKEEDEN
jgi:hypothetical protein